MTKDGHAVALLSGELAVDQRASVIGRFRRGIEKVLITTNVSARGRHCLVFSCSSVFIVMSVVVRCNQRHSQLASDVLTFSACWQLSVIGLLCSATVQIYQKKSASFPVRIAQSTIVRYYKCTSITCTVFDDYAFYCMMDAALTWPLEAHQIDLFTLFLVTDL